MKAIDIRFIPQAEMRQAATGVGDWWYEGDVLHVRAVESEDTTGDFLIALHELVEAVLCEAHGVSQQAVDLWDLNWVAPGNDPDAEPGDAMGACYRKEHRAAALIEHLMASFLGLDSYGTVR